jgi:uncharacterized Tic20 family protein
MEYYPIPQPNEISSREKEDAMGAYFMMFASAAIGLPLPIINIVAAIIYYYTNRDKGRFVQFNTLQSLYSQFPVSLLNIGLFIWTIRNFVYDIDFSPLFWGYLAMVAVFNIIYLIFSIIGALKANKGVLYYFLFFGKLAYHQVYRVRKTKHDDALVNRPPM